MKQFTSLLVATVLWAGVVHAQQPSTENTILQNEDALGKAMIQRDVATLSRLVADDWTIQSDSGSTGTKAGFIDDVKSGALVVSRFTLHDMHVRVFGDVAVVQGADDEQSSYKGTPSSGTYNWLDVWVKRDGQWVSIATQLTRVANRK